MPQLEVRRFQNFRSLGPISPSAVGTLTVGGYTPVEQTGVRFSVSLKHVDLHVSAGDVPKHTGELVRRQNGPSVADKVLGPMPTVEAAVKIDDNAPVATNRLTPGSEDGSISSQQLSHRRGPISSLISLGTALAVAGAGSSILGGCGTGAGGGFGEGASYNGPVRGIIIAGVSVPDAFVGPLMKYGQRCGLNPRMLASQMKAEDNFTDITSVDNAIGPAQVIPHDHPDVAAGGNLHDPAYAVHAMEIIDCQNRGGLIRHGTGGDLNTNILAAYNAGLGGAENADGNVGALPSQTQGYIAKIENTYMPETRFISGAPHRSHSSLHPGGHHSGGGNRHHKDAGFYRRKIHGQLVWCTRKPRHCDKPAS